MTQKAIVCVDDEAIILLSLKQELQNSFGEAYIYETALNAEQALSIVDALCQEGVAVILIISDWLMPGMRGDEFLDKVHARYPDINFIMITGQAENDAIVRTRKIPGVRGIVHKPWKSEELKELVASVVS